MPALQPPSMQIGVLPPGYMALPSVGPSPGNSAPVGSYPAFFQNAGAATGTSGPANISQPVNATHIGTTLVWAVAVNSSAAAALGGTPTGWTLQTSQTTATLAVAVYTWQNNPGGITSVTFSSNATATTGGIASWFWELGNSLNAPFTALSQNGSSTALVSTAMNPTIGGGMLLGVAAWVLGTATFNSTSVGGSSWSTNAQQSSTAGTTNAAIETGQNQVPPINFSGNANFKGNLSVSSVWVGAILLVPTTASGTMLASSSRDIVVDQGAGYGTGDTGLLGWSLGPTKPGGAGSGQ